MIELFFKNYLENMDNFLASHFKNPDDGNLLMVFAEWLEENDEPHMAFTIRQIIEGHDEGNGKEWKKEINNALHEIQKSIKFTFNDQFLMTFRLEGDNNLYKVNPKTGIKINDVKLPKEKWTPEIVKASIYQLLVYYSKNYFGSSHFKSRPAGFESRQLEALSVHIGRVIQNVNVNIFLMENPYSRPAAQSLLKLVSSLDKLSLEWVNMQHKYSLRNKGIEKWNYLWGKLIESIRRLDENLLRNNEIPAIREASRILDNSFNYGLMLQIISKWA